MDTTHLEYTAEDLISHKLMRAGILVAKPKFDRDGTDLLAFLRMADGVKFCRIQCKGRSLRNSDSNIRIPTAYVTNGFVVFLYLEDDGEEGLLFCFLASAIQTWPVNRSNEYVLSLSKSTFRDKLAIHRFDQSTIDLIQALIQNAEVSGEFKRLVHGAGDLRAQSSQVSGNGTVSS